MYSYVHIKTILTSARARAEYYDMGGPCHISGNHDTGLSLQDLGFKAG
jgi:hypothetical protein